jgi:copper(I)-binding protein
VKPAFHLLLPAFLALGACHHAPKGPDAPATEVKPGIVLTDGRLVLPAVKGNPAAAYFTVANQAGAAAHVVKITVAGANSAEMHETVGGEMRPVPVLDLAPGQHVLFAPGGRHVMVFGLPATVKPGDKLEITLHFRSGHVAMAQLTAESAGGMSGASGMDGMPGMDHH